MPLGPGEGNAGRENQEARASPAVDREELGCGVLLSYTRDYFVMATLGIIFSFFSTLPQFTFEEFCVPVLFFLFGIGGIVLFERLYVKKKISDLLRKSFSKETI